MILPAANPWRAATPARLALGRAGVSVPTDESLHFGLAHALARDAVHAGLDVDALDAALQSRGWRTARARSEAGDRATYLRRPDLGRRLAALDPPPDGGTGTGSGSGTDATGTGDNTGPGAGAFTTPAPHSAWTAPACDLCFVVADGLSALAAQRHAVPLLDAVRGMLPTTLSIGPVVIATQARVALGDDIGERLRAGIVAVLIGERPGLSAPDSLGVYLTHAPRRGRTDAERNCVSNIRPQGLRYEAAAARLAWLIGAARSLGVSGVSLKDLSDGDAPDAIGAAGAQAPADTTPRGREPPPLRGR
ncbi:MAG: ethanolamine ammonia-lyase subunit EutC [Lautropia sp.]